MAANESSHVNRITVFLICCGLSVRACGFAGGTGEPNDPYQIATAEHLASIGSDPNLLDKHFVLVADIDLDPNLPGGQVFTRAVIAPDTNDAPYRFDGVPFGGSFDGGGFTLAKLTIRGCEYVGLFGAVGPHGVVSDVRIRDAHIVGEQNATYVGTLAGHSEGSISRCHVSTDVHFGSYPAPIGNMGGGLVGSNTGRITNCSALVNVTGDIAILGGLAGGNGGSISGCFARGRLVSVGDAGGLLGTNGGLVASCYAMVDVAGRAWTRYLGGLVGCNDGTVGRCYSVGTVFNGLPEDSYSGGLIGGLAGDWGEGSVANSFWDTDVSVVHTSDGGMGVTTSEMMEPETYSLHGWGDDPNWVLDAGHDYPRLAWEGTPGEPIPVPSIDWFDGRGTPEDPYVIATADQLARIGTASVLWDKAFSLVCDIDLTGVEVPRIGICRGTDFSGIFSGNGHTIGNLTLDTGEAPNATSAGLFGYVGDGGRVRDLVLEKASIRCGWGFSGAGTLAGTNEGTIANCWTSGTVSAGEWSSNLGGLVGENRGRILSCSCRSHVSGGEDSEGLGGLVGQNLGTITRCRAETSASGTRLVGGLLGSLWFGVVSKSYATGTVRGQYSVGGLVGHMNFAEIADCYATTGVLAEGNGDRFGGLVGYNNKDWDRDNVRDSFWDIEASGLAVSAGGTGLTTGEMQDANTYLAAGWDFVGETHNGTADLWLIGSEGGYPELTFFSDEYERRVLPGSGTPGDPYLIASAGDLFAISHYDIWACYELVADVDLAGITSMRAPITYFDGHFDGAAKTISNLTLEGRADLGLFGILGERASVVDLGIRNAKITGLRNLAILAGTNEGSIARCYADGTLTGATVASLVANNQGSIADSYATGTVTDDYRGGSGLVSDNFGRICRCYTTTRRFRAPSTEVRGRLVEDNWRGVVSDSYFLVASPANGPDDEQGTSLTDGQMKQQASFVNWDFADTWMICEGRDYPRLRWEQVGCGP